MLQSGYVVQSYFEMTKKCIQGAEQQQGIALTMWQSARQLKTGQEAAAAQEADEGLGSKSLSQLQVWLKQGTSCGPGLCAFDKITLCTSGLKRVIESQSA